MTDRQRAFVEYYLGVSNGNATDAARRAGYKDAAATGCRLRQRPEVRQAIEERLAEAGVTREHVLSELAECLKADLADLVEVTPEGSIRLRLSAPNPKTGVQHLKGPTHLLRAINTSRSGVRVEVLDRLKAITLLGKFLGLWQGRPADPAEGEFSAFAKAILESAKHDA